MSHPYSDAFSRRIGLVIVLPLVFALLGGWQLHRAAGQGEQYDAQAARQERAVARLEPIAARSPDQPIPVAGSPIPYPAARLLALVRDDAEKLRRDALVARLRQGVAAVTAAAALAALLVGAAGLAMAARVGRRALLSRAELAERFMAVRRRLPALLGVQVAGLCAAVSGAVLFETAGAWYADRHSSGELKLVGLAVLLAGAVLYVAFLTLRDLAGTLAAFKPDPLAVLGREADAQAAPGLWSLVAGVAAAQRAPVPDHIVAGLDPGFFVTSSDVVLRPEERTLRGRTLHVPLPMLAMLDREEVSAVVAHELAHFTGEDTEYTQRFLPVYAGIGRSLEAVGNVHALERWALLPAATLGRHMMAVFDAAVNHWSRLRELAADAASVPAGGPAPVGSALIRTGLVGAVADGVLSETMQRPRAAPPDLVAHAAARAMQSGFHDPAAHLENRQPHPTDSHPPTRQRIEAVGQPIDAGLLARAARPVEDTGFARSLFQDWDGLCTALTSDFLTLAVEQDDGYEAALQEAARLPEGGSVAVFENTRRWQLWLGAIAAVLLGVGALSTFARAEDSPLVISFSNPVFSATAGFWLAGVAAVVLAVLLPRWLREPFLTLHPDGFTCRGLDRAVPWLDVDRVELADYGAVSTFLFLLPPAPLPQRLSGWRTRANRRKRCVTLIGLRPRGMTLQEYYDLIVTFHQAALARALLEERHAGPAGARVEAGLQAAPEPSPDA